MTVSNTEIFDAIQNAYHCQRNWDHTQTIPQHDIDLILNAARHAPTKQGETHYKIYWTTDRTKIQPIYERTPFYSVYDPAVNYDGIVQTDGNFPPEYMITNPQVNANMIIAICDDWDPELARARTHMVIDNDTIEEDLYTHIVKHRQMDLGVGVCIGNVIMTANLLGYRTGLCSAFDEQTVLGIPDTFCKHIIGIGFPDPSRNRREHPDVLNSDIFVESMRNGANTANWIFPSFDKVDPINEIP